MSGQIAKQTTPKAFNIFFALLMVGMSFYFVWWGLDFTNFKQVALFLVAAFFGIFMAFNIGGNDVANSFGTSVGAGTLSVTQALAIAAVFEVSGAVLAGAAVTDTIRSGIVDLGSLKVGAEQFVYVMLSALMAAAFWLLIATKKGLPVSTTHAIVGGIVGSSMVLGIKMGGASFAFSTVQWGEMGQIAVSWVLSPLLGAVFAYILYMFIKKYILNYNDEMERILAEIKQEKKLLKEQKDTHKESLQGMERELFVRALDEDLSKIDDGDVTSVDELVTDYHKGKFLLAQKRDNLDTVKALRLYAPLIAAFGAMVMTAMVVFKGLKHTGVNPSTLNAIFAMGLIGALVWVAVFSYVQGLSGKKKQDLGKATFIVFSWMQVFTACAFAFSHGSNDIANAVGPFVAILDVIRTGVIADSVSVPPPVMLTFGVALIVGLWFIGKEVIQTVGKNLAELHPSSGFAAELAAAAVVMAASSLGLPVSSTHILVGAVLGIGIANKNTNWAMMKPIGLAWVITLPAAAMMSVVGYLVLNVVF